MERDHAAARVAHPAPADTARVEAHIDYVRDTGTFPSMKDPDPAGPEAEQLAVQQTTRIPPGSSERWIPRAAGTTTQMERSRRHKTQGGPAVSREARSLVRVPAGWQRLAPKRNRRDRRRTRPWPLARNPTQPPPHWKAPTLQSPNPERHPA